MNTNIVEIEIQATDDFLSLIGRAAAVAQISTEAFVLDASVAAAMRLLSVHGGPEPAESPRRPA
jgi:uncharacterized protein (DUF1778 family)